MPLSLAALLFCCCLFKQTLYLLVVRTGKYLPPKNSKCEIKIVRAMNEASGHRTDGAQNAVWLLCCPRHQRASTCVCCPVHVSARPSSPIIPRRGRGCGEREPITIVRGDDASTVCFTAKAQAVVPPMCYRSRVPEKFRKKSLSLYIYI